MLRRSFLKSVGTLVPLSIFGFGLRGEASKWKKEPVDVTLVDNKWVTPDEKLAKDLKDKLDQLGFSPEYVRDTANFRELCYDCNTKKYTLSLISDQYTVSVISRGEYKNINRLSYDDHKFATPVTQKLFKIQYYSYIYPHDDYAEQWVEIANLEKHQINEKSTKCVFGHTQYGPKTFTEHV